MELKTYRKYARYSLRQLAAELGCTGQLLSMIERGKCYPSRKLAKRIQAFTDGQVKASELLELDD